MLVFIGPHMQCGGKGWTGPKSCASGLVCKKLNDYYKQCVKDASITDIAQEWEQCSGKGYNGPAKCAASVAPRHNATAALVS